MGQTLIQGGTIVSGNSVFSGSILISGEKIDMVYKGEIPDNVKETSDIFNAEGLHIFPGIIDTHVHFREPGLTHKADIYSESKAAVAGGVTSYMEMPNTIPPATTIELLEQKYSIASDKSLANYSFYLGASDNNLNELLSVNRSEVCGIKVFLGSSTGNMLISDSVFLDKLFSKTPVLLVIHAEDEEIIKQNSEFYRKKFGNNIPVIYHPKIRTEEACFKSSSFAVKMAERHGTRIHLAHLSTLVELELLGINRALADKKITAEVCTNHLAFDETDYAKLGTRIKCNPAIKSTADKNALLEGLNSGLIDSVATDHAPHTPEEKQLDYFSCPSGIPMVQHGFVSMLEFYHSGKMKLERIAEAMCHAPADIFRINDRGYIHNGFQADLVIVDLKQEWKVKKTNILTKCGWSPFEGKTFRSKVISTFINGHQAYCHGKFNESVKGQRLRFSH